MTKGLFFTYEVSQIELYIYVYVHYCQYPPLPGLQPIDGGFNVVVLIKRTANKPASGEVLLDYKLFCVQYDDTLVCWLKTTTVHLDIVGKYLLLTYQYSVGELSLPSNISYIWIIQLSK